MQLPGLLLSPSLKKLKKSNPKKKFIFREIELFGPKIKKFLFSKENFSYILRNGTF